MGGASGHTSATYSNRVTLSVATRLPTYLLDTALHLTLQSPPLELAGDQLVAAHGGRDLLLPVLGEGAPACLLRMKLGWVPFWLIDLQDGNADRL